MDDEFFKSALERIENGEAPYDPLLLLNEGENKNYSTSRIKCLWGEFADDVKNGLTPDLLNFYVHIPFCKRKCVYCTYFSAPPEEGDIDHYLLWLQKNVEYFCDAFKELSFCNLYVGGGTPVLLDVKQMERIFNSIFKNYTIHERGEKTCEVNPVFVTREKLKLLKDFGFNRISMGVQTFSKKALSLSNRGYQTVKMVERAVEKIMALDLYWGLNVDLIRGLEGDDESSFVATFRRICSLGPSQIVVYPLILTERYCRRFHPDGHEAFSKTYYEKTASLPGEIAPVADSAGYAYSNLSPFSAWVFFSKSNHEKLKFLVAGDDTRFIYDDIPLLPFSLFGLGPSSRSLIYSRLSYAAESEIFTDFQPDSEIYTGRAISRRMAMAKFVVVSLRKEASCDLYNFRKFFGSELKDAFSSSVGFLRKTGRIRVRNGKLEVPSKDRKDILACCACFVSEAKEL